MGSSSSRNANTPVREEDEGTRYGDFENADVVSMTIESLPSDEERYNFALISKTMKNYVNYYFFTKLPFVTNHKYIPDYDYIDLNYRIKNYKDFGDIVKNEDIEVMKYYINIPETGKYRLDFFIASSIEQNKLDIAEYLLTQYDVELPHNLHVYREEGDLSFEAIKFLLKHGYVFDEAQVDNILKARQVGTRTREMLIYAGGRIEMREKMETPTKYPLLTKEEIRELIIDYDLPLNDNQIHRITNAAIQYNDRDMIKKMVQIGIDQNDLDVVLANYVFNVYHDRDNSEDHDLVIFLLDHGAKLNSSREELKEANDVGRGTAKILYNYDKKYGNVFNE